MVKVWPMEDIKQTPQLMLMGIPTRLHSVGSFITGVVLQVNHYLTLLVISAEHAPGLLGHNGTARARHVRCICSNILVKEYSRK